MHRNQHNNRTLEPFTVKPGPETGLYYILVANVRETRESAFGLVLLTAMYSSLTGQHGET
jgi:hypothetical protein